MIAEHAILSAIPIDEHTQEPYFVRLPEIVLDECVNFQERQHPIPSPEGERDVELDEMLSKQHSIPYHAPSPFWRLCILTSSAQPQDFTAAFFFHHALGDGGSGMAFHRSLHRALNHTILNLGDGIVNGIISSPSTPLLPTLESLHPLPVTTWHLLKIVFREKVWRPSPDPGLWTGGKCKAPLGQPRIRHLAFPAASTIELKNVCRQNETTITTALQTLLAGVLFSHLPARHTTLTCTVPLSARRLLSQDAGITEDAMGVWYQDTSETYTRASFKELKGTDIDVLPWSEAQRSRRSVEQALALNGVNAGVNLLRYVNNFQEELFLSKVGKDRGQSLEVSNLGLFKTTHSGENGREGSGIKIGRMIFTQSSGVTASAIQVSIITGADGCLVLGVSWQQGVVDDELVEKVLGGVEAEIQRLTGGAMDGKKSL